MIKEIDNLNNFPPQEKDDNSSQTTQSKDNSFFIPCADSVRLRTPIRERFDVLLRRIGRSQNWLSDEVGISKATMSRIANGDWFPQSDIMIRICKILDVESCALFGDSKHWKTWNDKMIYKKQEAGK